MSVGVDLNDACEFLPDLRIEEVFGCDSGEELVDLFRVCVFPFDVLGDLVGPQVLRQ